MSDRKTTVWVPIDRLVTHPRNVNEMPKELIEKLRDQIKNTGRYPPLIVRSLENSIEFAEQHEQHKLQIIDGEHRYHILKELGMTEIHVFVWEGCGDEEAKTYLLTLNRLQGKDNKAKRAALIRELLGEIEAEELAAILPEDEETLSAMNEEEEQEAVRDAMRAADNVSRNEHFLIYVTLEQKEIITAAISGWLAENDPDFTVQECREGYALAAICGEADQ